MKNIYASTWFQPGATYETIGIVIVSTDHDFRAYIGIGEGQNQDEDEQNIANWGAKFPLETAAELIGIRLPEIKNTKHLTKMGG